jgi:hypothetical protein
MTEAGAILQSILRQGWVVMAAFLAMIALLGALAQVFKFTGGVFLGSSIWVSEAVAGVLGVIVIALFGFLAVPVLARSAFITAKVGCGPVIEIGQFSAILIGGVGSLRMLKGVFQAVVSASMGGSSGVSAALIEIAETLFGMLLITVAAPVGAAFFGAC